MVDLKQYEILQNVYNYFNLELFEGKLPEVIFLLNYDKKNKLGFFHYERLSLKENGDNVSIISLNFDYFSQPDIKSLSTIVHEMCHVWEFYFEDKQPTNGYHTKAWSKKMKQIGLMPSNGTGKSTGKNMHHIIIVDELFEQKARKFLKSNKSLFLFSGESKKKITTTAKKSKLKYICSCDVKLYGKSDLDVKCNKCQSDFECEEEE